MRTRRLPILGAAALLATSAFAALGSVGASAAPAKPTVTIGVIAPVDGGLTSFGQGIRDSVELAVAQANKKKAIPGWTIKVKVLDDSSDPAKGKQAATTMAADPNVVAVIGPYNSGVALMAAPVLAKDPSYNSVLHTTCIPTLLSAGHANNALPQRADANINCRIFPGTSVEEVRAKLQELVGDSEIKVTASDKRSEVPKGPQPLTPVIFKPVENLAAKMWPGVPVVPFMSAGATDGAFLTPAGIPTYGVSGMFGDPDGNGAHGLNERLRVKSVYDGRDFLYQIVKVYAQAK